MTPHPLAERAFAGLCAYARALAFDAPDYHSPAKWGQMILVVLAVALPFYAAAPVPVWKQALLFAWPFVFVFTFKMAESMRRAAKPEGV